MRLIEVSTLDGISAFTHVQEWLSGVTLLVCVRNLVGTSFQVIWEDNLWIELFRFGWFNKIKHKLKIEISILTIGVYSSAISSHLIAGDF